ncbi:hypothetical protein KC19_12G142100 [Ceratodon purpureus]|uniref:PGG domain-containing protein n=1 Tax=Ceratodon purpureus TaxID=3225 RepID=A0A8T0GAQ2_CERPU|nr:hypothetical protein KC19_12G142100 [Ceratodon purpureus]
MVMTRGALARIEAENKWVEALQRRDCLKLMDLLKKDSQLWINFTDPKELTDHRSVLHVAVMQGCVDLIKQVLTSPNADKNSKKEFQMNAKKLLKAKDGKTKADAFQMADIVGNQEVIQTLLDLAQENGFVNDRYARRASDKSSFHGVVSPEFQTPDVSHSIDIRESTDKLIADLIETLRKSSTKLALEELEGQMNENVDYNFVKRRKGLIFNFACKRAFKHSKFICSVTAKAEEENLLEDLFNQQDSQGRTPLHVAIDHFLDEDDVESRVKSVQLLLNLIPDECVNGVDGAGRTPLHRATVNGMSLESCKAVKVLVEESRTDLNAQWPKGSGTTALHLAVLHCHSVSAKILLNAPTRLKDEHKVNVELKMKRPIKIYNNFGHGLNSTWTPLELAAVMGRYSVVVEFLKASGQGGKPKICDDRCLHLAAAAGEPRVVQALLMNQSRGRPNFESNQNFGGYSCLHFAVNATLPYQPFSGPQMLQAQLEAIDFKFDRFLAFSDYASVYWLGKELASAKERGLKQDPTLKKIEGPLKHGLSTIGYGSKKVCTKLLLQAGVNIWPTEDYQIPASSSNKKSWQDLRKHFGIHLKPIDQEFDIGASLNQANAIPDPGIDANDDDRLWWYELVARETQEAQNNFNAAGSATAVVATLVATASFIGPLQPPLGYGSDGSSISTLNTVQVTRGLPIRVFMVSNSLSFYLAIASILLAIMPSLPVPQDGLREELHRYRRIVAWAITMLLMSILGILISFTAALIAVVPEDYQWGLKFYPAFAGSMVCILVLFVFFLRLMRVIFDRNRHVKSFYRMVFM